MELPSIICLRPTKWRFVASGINDQLPTLWPVPKLARKFPREPRYRHHRQHILRPAIEPDIMGSSTSKPEHSGYQWKSYVYQQSGSSPPARRSNSLGKIANPSRKQLRCSRRLPPSPGFATNKPRGTIRRATVALNCMVLLLLRKRPLSNCYNCIRQRQKKILTWTHPDRRFT